MVYVQKAKVSTHFFNIWRWKFQVRNIWGRGWWEKVVGRYWGYHSGIIVLEMNTMGSEDNDPTNEIIPIHSNVMH